MTGDFQKAELRSDKEYTSNSVVKFIRPLFDYHQETIHVSTILVRADSDFATPEQYELHKKYQSYYVIRLKSNRNLEKIAERFIFINDQHYTIGIKKKSIMFIQSVKRKAGCIKENLELNLHVKKMS